MVVRLGSVSAQFHRPRVNPRCVAKGSRFVVSAQRAGPAPVCCQTSSCARRRTGRGGEPPAVGYRGHGGVGGVCRPQIPVGAADSDLAHICHR